MFSSRNALSLLCVLLIAGLAWGQATTAPATTIPSKAEPILDVIPAGTLGFVCVQNVGKSLAASENYLKYIGVFDTLPIAGDLVSTLKSAAQLGEGFNPDGGFGVAMMDPQPLGVDLQKMIDEEANEAPAAEKQKLPFVLFVPGSSLKEIFGKYEMVQEDDLTKISLRMGPTYAAMLKGYAVLSPNAKAVAAVVKADKSATSELSKDLLERLAAADLAIHINTKASGPTLHQLMEVAKKKMQAAPGRMPFAPDELIGFYSKMIDQLRTICLTLKFGTTGLIVQEFVDVDPQSDMGKAMASMPNDRSASLDRLPDLPYVLAIGGLPGPKGPWEQQMMDMVMKAFPNVNQENRAKIEKFQSDISEQVTATQLVIGGAPEGAGVFGMAAVLACKDADKTKAVLAQGVDTIASIIQSMASSENKESPQFKVEYKKDAEKSDSLSVDAIEITPPDFANLSDDEKEGVRKVLGEDKIRMLVTSPDNKTVVITFGGGATMLTEALKAGKGGGAIPKDAGVMETAKIMPANPRMLLVLDVAHLMAVVQKATAVLGVPMPPVQFTAKTPVAIGGAVQGETTQTVIYVPNDLVKDIVNFFKMMRSPMGEGGGAPAPTTAPKGGESF